MQKKIGDAQAKKEHIEAKEILSEMKVKCDIYLSKNSK